MRSCITLLLLATLSGCTTLRVASPQQAAALDDLDWQVERPAAPPPAEQGSSEVPP